MTELGWSFHRNHDLLMNEVHARPAAPIPGPSDIIHFSFRASAKTSDAFFRTVTDDQSATKARHVTGRIDGARIKLERHTEFVSCTLFAEIDEKDRITNLEEIIAKHFPISKVEILVLLHLHIVGNLRQMMRLLPHDERVYGGRIGGSIDARSTFKPDEKGYVRFFIHGQNITSDEMGRRVQRLIEMETYRSMMLLGLPKARQINSKITQIETELDALTVQLRENTKTTVGRDGEFFHDLSDLSERANLLVRETRYRFSASRAYYALFRNRLDALAEEKVGDVQTMRGFLRARIDPAIATIESTVTRQDHLADDLSRALNLLRTRIELNMNRGNQDLLKSMDRRHDQQVKISQAVEGLSIIAITYYAVGLASYLLKAVAAQSWMPFSEKLLTAFSVPFILLFVWYALKKTRKAWEQHSG